MLLFRTLFLFYYDKIYIVGDIMEREIIDQLISAAKEIANRNFCCKHSNFTVGVALLTKDIYNNKVKKIRKFFE